MDTLPQWLYWRFAQDVRPWDELDEDDQLKWVHEADAVRRAVARDDFKTVVTEAQDHLARNST